MNKPRKERQSFIDECKMFMEKIQLFIAYVNDD